MTWSSSSMRSRAGLSQQGQGQPKPLSLWTELHSPEQLKGQRATAAAEQAAADAQAGHQREVEEAYRRGTAEGREAGERRAHLELAAAIRAAEGALAGLIDAEKTHQRELNENLAALAVAVARKIVERELTTDPDTVTALVRTAVALFPQDQGLKIRVNPRDLSHICAAIEGREDGERAVGTREVRWIPDEAVVPGGCVVEGPDRVVDGRVDRALEHIFRALKDA